MKTCSHDDCSIKVYAKRLCKYHYSQARASLPSARKCDTPGCGKPHYGKGMCKTCYQHHRRKSVDRPACKTDQCENPVNCRGMCDACYQQWKRKDETRTKCSVHDCEDVTIAKGLCQKHYLRMRTHGSPVAGRAEDGSGWKFLSDLILKPPTTECVFWPFGRSTSGYPTVRIPNTPETQSAHRLALIMSAGEPPSDIHVAAHSCGNGHLGCVNPGCLRWATPRENSEDTRNHGTIAIGARHGNAKLTEHQVRQIRVDERMNSQLAKVYGVSPGTISSIRMRTTWKHVD